MAETGLRILVVDDERAIRRFLRASLSVHGHDILEAASGAEALAVVAEQRPDVVFLDLGLPDADGIDVIRQLREWSSVPVIILSVRDQEKDKIEALDAGADDYLTKPFGIGELMARVRGVVRRTVSASPGSPLLIFGELQLDFSRRIVLLRGKELALTPTEYEILKVLAQNAGKVLTHLQIIRKVWGAGYGENEAHLLRVNISNLRKKIEPDPTQPSLIVTEPGVGYRFRFD
ncbi:MAG: response regulator [Anaerolineales bacterium]|jgi:two-component system KDP operon response regulator KdpE|nr:response regulator [Anaerolineales bacterium]